MSTAAVAVPPSGAAVAAAAARPAEAFDAAGLSTTAALARRQRYGPNAVRTHRVSALAVLGRQLRSALLGLLLVAAFVSFLLGQRTDAVVIGFILAVSVGLGFANEYRAERAGAALHDRIRHEAAVLRDGQLSTVDVTDLVPGDVVRVGLGAVVPADLRLVEVDRLECDESILTGESLPSAKRVEAVPAGTALGDLASCALMGTVVHAGSGTGVAVATGRDTAFGGIAVALGERHPETEFQAGLRRFSLLLAKVAGALTTVIFVINLILRRPVIDAVLFSLAIAVGITPQLLPAIVTTGLAAREPATGRREGTRQAPGVRGGPGQRRGALHRQDRDADRRQDPATGVAGLRRYARRAARAARAAGQRGHRRGGRQPARPCPLGCTALAGRRVHPGRTAALRPRPAPYQRPR